ncbi:MAG: hypothetical protein Q4D57_02330 [Clostridia bacterium]|nr:hypothetical protein [Clostridia bacterium]
MAIAITNKRKALNLLKEAGFNTTEIEKGDAKEFTLDADKLKDIVEGNKNNIFEKMNQAGKLLKDSIFTRSTGHKEHDFSSLQASSSLAFAESKEKIKNEIMAQNSDRKGWKDLDEESRKEIANGAAPIIRKIYKQFKSMYWDLHAKFELEIHDFVKCSRLQQIDKIKKAFDSLHNSGLSKHIVYTPDQNLEEGEDILKYGDGYQAKLVGGVTAASLGLSGPVFLVPGLGTSLVPLTIVGAAAMGAGAFIGIVMAVTFAILNHKKESLGAIKNKRAIIKLQENYEKAIKYLNDLEDYLETEISKKIKQDAKKVELNENIIKIIEDFLKVQAEKWDHYTTAAKRGYTIKSEKDKENNKHISGLVHVSDEKTSGIGKAKQGFAKQWCKLKIKPS